MAISINKIQNIKRPVSITIDGEDLNCTYRLGVLSSDLSYWLRDHANDEGSLFEMCEKLLVSWDLVDGYGHTITPTRAALLLTWLKKQGLDDALIQPYSGHTSRQSLEVYSRLALGDAQAEYDQAMDQFPV